MLFRGFLAGVAFCVGGGFFSGEAIATFADFFDFAATLEMLEDARKIAAAAMLQFHAMSDFADALRTVLRGKISEDIGVACLFRPLVMRAPLMFIFHGLQASGNYELWQKS